MTDSFDPQAWEHWTPAAHEQLVERLREADTPRRVWYCTRGRTCDGKPHEGAMDHHARGGQYPPPGTNWVTWALISGRGCIAPWSRIELADGTTGRVDVLAARGQSVEVRTLYGSAWTDGPPFVKGIADLFTVRMSDGSTATVTDQHRFLTPHGWLPLASVRVGQPLASPAPAPHGSDALGRYVSLADARRWTGTPAGSRPGCPTCPRCGDPLPHPGAAGDLASAPRSDGAAARIRSSRPQDVPESGSGCSHACLPAPPRSRTRSGRAEPWPGGASDPDGSGRLGPPPRSIDHPGRLGSLGTSDPERAVLSAGPRGYLLDAPRLHVPAALRSTHGEAWLRLHPGDAGWWSTTAQPPRRLLGGSSHPRTAAASAPGSRMSPCAVDELSYPLPPDAAGSSRRTGRSHRRPPGLTALTRTDDAVLLVPRVSSWVTVVSVEFSHRGVFYDLTVPDGEHYTADGVWGHNSGKSRAAAEYTRKVTEKVSRVFLVGATGPDVRDTMIEGPSGLIYVCERAGAPIKWEPSKRKITFANGAEGHTFCVPPDTEALTPSGWKPYTELKVGDLIRSLDHDSGLARWEPIRAMNVFQVEDEPMIDVKMNRFSTLCTMAHRWPTVMKKSQKRVMRDSLLEFTTHDQVILGAPASDLPTTSPYTPEFAALVGWYTAEGHIMGLEAIENAKCTDRAGLKDVARQRKAYLGWSWADVDERYGGDALAAIKCGLAKAPDRARMAYALGIAQSTIDGFFEERIRRASVTIYQKRDSRHTPGIDRVISAVLPQEEALAGVSCPAYRRTDDGRMVVWHLNHEAAQMLLAVCDGEHKAVRLDFINSLTREGLEAFVQAVIDGDGYRPTDRSFNLLQKDSRRLDSVEMACILLGLSVRRSPQYGTLDLELATRHVRPIETRKRVMFDQEVISVTQEAVASPVDSRRERIALRRYSGVVWCPTLDTGTWLARREGSVYFTGNSSEEPDRLRGPQAGFSWCDEFVHWANLAGTWDNMLLGLRMGTRPHIVATSTPLPSPWLKALIAEPTTVVTRESTYANLDNLPKVFADAIIKRYEGTRLGKQELLGEILEDVEGALWTQQMIQDAQERQIPDRFDRVVVAVDPAGTSKERSDETGIIVLGRSGDKVYVLADYSGRYTPHDWAKKVATVYDLHSADVVVAENNYGGEMVSATLRNAREFMRIQEVNSRRGKLIRAEPVVALYERGSVKHTANLQDLEDQLLSWIPGKGKSPDRLDALVHGVHALVRTERPTSLSRPRSMPLRPIRRTSPALERMGVFK